MTVESLQGYKLKVKDLAVQANNALDEFGSELAPVSEAISKLEFVSRIMSSDPVRESMGMSGARIQLVGNGVLGLANGFRVTSEGFSRTWLEGPGDSRGIRTQLVSSLTPSKDAMIQLFNDDRGLVKRIAKLKEEEIIKKFRKALKKSAKLS